MTKRDIHVVPHEDGWATRRERADRVSDTHRTQGDAINTARERAKRDGVEVVIHRPRSSGTYAGSLDAYAALGDRLAGLKRTSVG